MKLEPGFELVHSVLNYHDGPLAGIADFDGKPYYYEREFDYTQDEDDLIYLLSSIDMETFKLACESWKIWRRWETAYHRGEATLETHFALPLDRIRYFEIESLLQGKLVINKANAVRVRAEFLPREDADYNGVGRRPMQVKSAAILRDKELSISVKDGH